jgi:phosphoglycerate dehydrogenase-like enzyme
MWPKLTGLKWLHSASAGLDTLLFPELIESDVIVTNAKGVYSHSLAEYALTCCNFFAKDIRRLRASQAKSSWDPFEVEELRGALGYLVECVLELGCILCYFTDVHS